MRNRKKKKVYEITRRQILLALIIAAIALTVTFELGVSTGRKRVINAEREAERRDSVRWSSTPPETDEAPQDQSTQRPGTGQRAKPEAAQQKDRESHPAGSQSLPDRPMVQRETEKDEELKPARREDAQAQAATKAPTGGNLPLELPPEQPEVEETEARYTIQVGTFSSAENAENLVNLLRSYEYKSWFRTYAAGEKTLHSVFVGGFDRRDEAERFGRLLQDRLSFLTEYVVRKIQENQ